MPKGLVKETGRILVRELLHCRCIWGDLADLNMMPVGRSSLEEASRACDLLRCSHALERLLLILVKGGRSPGIRFFRAIQRGHRDQRKFKTPTKRLLLTGVYEVPNRKRLAPSPGLGYIRKPTRRSVLHVGKDRPIPSVGPRHRD